MSGFDGNIGFLEGLEVDLVAIAHARPKRTLEENADVATARFAEPRSGAYY